MNEWTNSMYSKLTADTTNVNVSGHKCTNGIRLLEKCSHIKYINSAW
jgi:hypothetical protein